jgi:hypothetical protein
VRTGELARHQIAKLEGGRAWVVVGGLGLPRLWSYGTTHALAGYAKALDAARGRPPGERLEGALTSARAALASACDCLVEKQVPDVVLLGLLVDSGTLHVLCAGAGRVYVQRAGAPQRLTPRDDPRDGLLFAEATRSSLALEPGDLVLAGSVSAFSVRGVARLAAVLEEDPRATPSVLVSVLTEPAALAGVGAAAVALRVE